MRLLLKYVPAALLALCLGWSVSPSFAQGIPWVASYEKAQQQAAQQNRLVLLHFWSRSCGPCLKLEQGVFNRSEVVRAMDSGYVPVKINVTESQELARRFNIRSIPTDVILTPAGNEVYRSVTPQQPDKYIALLDQVAAHARVGRSAPPADPHSVARQAEESVPWNEGGTPPAAGPAPVENRYTQSASVQNNPYIQNQPSGAPTAPAYGAQVQGSRYGDAPAQPAAQPAANRYSNAPPTGPPAGVANRYSSQPAPQHVAQNPQLNGPQFGGPQTGGPQTGGPQTGGPQTGGPQTGGRATGQSPAPRGPATSAQNPTQPGYNASPPAQPQATTPPPHAAGTHPRSAVVPPAGNGPAGTQTAPRNTPIGLDGFCPVRLIHERKWIAGDARFHAFHRGRVYHFSGPRELQAFQSNPEMYSPVLGGFDPVKYKEQGQLVEGKRQHGVFCYGRIFLFADEEALARFWTSPDVYLGPNGQNAQAAGPAGTAPR